ncbi:TolC family protein [Robertkochia marina]|uniref:TolC family protein n=1 Tax=Robertkochia marina TaxID=1227945 RepID=A0A4S3M229_9FLAO|nr:TolC family protein [Robertkochia marina]THD69116.1 TolC family protein [Robertkochia marina]TRZ47625.1 TolC family protein [Robertkochia marina]
MNKYLVLGLLFSIFTVTAQEKQYSFSLDEAIDFALDSSYTAMNSRREVAKALKRKWETTASGLPQIDANVDYQNQLKQPVSPIPAEFFGGEPGEFVPVVFGVQQQMNATATLRQLIFDGSYLVGLEAASTFLDYNENADEKTRLEVRKAVINAYGGVLVTRERAAILQKDKANLEENLRETTATFENGLAEEESVEQLQITLSQIDTELSNSQRLQEIAEQMLNITLGIPVDARVELKDDLSALAVKNMGNDILDQELSLEENIDFKIARNLTEQRELELKLEKSRALPTLNAFVNYGTTAFDQDFVFLDGQTPWFQSSILGVSLNIPIFSSLLRSARTQQAKIALDQSQTSFREITQQIELEYNQAKSNFRYAVEKYLTSVKNLDLAERIEAKNQVKFREGIGSSFELRQAQTQLYRAQEEYIVSMLDVINAKAALETVLNTPQLRIDN